MNPNLSIIVPIYNTEKYLKECIESLLYQPYEAIEVILIDDGSSDGSGAICDYYGLKDSRVKVAHQENQGLSCARNAGIDIATGDYITFVDSDDFIGSETYESNMSILEQDASIDVLLYPSMFCYGSPLENKFSPPMERIRNIEVMYNKWFGFKINTSVCNKIFKRAIFNNLRFTPGVWFEDSLLMPNIIEQNLTWFISSVGIYNYRANENSFSKKKYNAEEYKQLFLTKCKLIDIIISHKFLKKYYIGYFARTIETYLHLISKCDREMHGVYFDKMKRYKFPSFVGIIKSEFSYRGKLKLFMLKVMGLRLSSFIFLLRQKILTKLCKIV